MGVESRERREEVLRESVCHAGPGRVMMEVVDNERAMKMRERTDRALLE